MNSNFVSVLSDGSTDRAIEEQEAVLVRFVYKGEPITAFVSVTDLEHVDAKGVYKGIVDGLKTIGLNIKDLAKRDSPGPMLISVNFDGASVMLGNKNGVATMFKRDIGNFVLPMWCVCHKLELSVLDTVKTHPGIQEFEKILKWLFKFYDKFNAKSRREAREMAKVLEEDFVYLPPLHEVLIML